MSASDEIRSKAELFGWQRYDGGPYEDIFVFADNSVYVQYGTNGSVVSGELRGFRSLTPGSSVLKERAQGKNKKPAVIAWLAEYS